MKIYKKNPISTVPIILHTNLGFNTKKYNIPSNMIVYAFINKLRTHINLKYTDSLFIFVNDIIPQCDKTIGYIHDKYSDKNGVLHITVSCDNIFGSFTNLNIKKETLKNKNYRKVLYTNNKQQLVLMSLNQGEDIPLERHTNISQLFKIEKGLGVALIGLKKKKIVLKTGSLIIIPPNTWHYIKNTSKVSLKLYTIYSPPEHSTNALNKRQKKTE